MSKEGLGARLAENDPFLAPSAMPVDDPQYPFGSQDRRDGAGQAELVGNTVEGICEEQIIDRFRHDRLDVHRLRHDELAIARLSDECPRPVEQVRVEIDRIDALVIPQSGVVNRPSSQHRSTTTMPGFTPISTRTPRGSGDNFCHQSASGIAVAGKKPVVMQIP
jgi:hypothetical protein